MKHRMLKQALWVICLILGIAMPSYAVDRTVMIHTGHDNLSGIDLSFELLEQKLLEQEDTLLVSAELVLDDVDLLIITMPEFSYSEEDVTTIDSFVTAGGKLLLLGEHGMYSKYQETLQHLNALASHFQLTFHSNVIIHESDGYLGTVEWLNPSMADALFLPILEDSLLLFHASAAVSSTAADSMSLVVMDGYEAVEFDDGGEDPTRLRRQSAPSASGSSDDLGRLGIDVSSLRSGTNSRSRSLRAHTLEDEPVAAPELAVVNAHGAGIAVAIGDLGWIGDSDPDANGTSNIDEGINYEFLLGLLDYTPPTAELTDLQVAVSNRFRSYDVSWSSDTEASNFYYQVELTLGDQGFGLVSSSPSASFTEVQSYGSGQVQVQISNGLHHGSALVSEPLNVPGTPEGGFLQSMHDSVRVSWDEMAFAETYHIYVSSFPGIDIENDTTYDQKLTTADLNVEVLWNNGQSVYALVSADDLDGQETVGSTEMMAVPYTPGDLNGDLVVNSIDALLLLQVQKGLRSSLDPAFETGYQGPDVFINGEHDHEINGLDNADMDKDADLSDADVHAVLGCELQLNPCAE